jgi:hypothetical protein
MGRHRLQSTGCHRWSIMNRQLLLAILALVLAALLWQCSEKQHGNVVGPTQGNPFIDSTSPRAEAVNVSRTSPIGVFFSRPMDVATMNSRKFRIDHNVMYSLSYDSLKAMIHVADTLDRFAEYRITVDSGIADKAGNVMRTPFSFSFRTETGHPAIAAISPSEGRTSVPLDAVVTVTFTMDMNPATIDSTSVQLSGNMLYTIAYAGRQLVLTPVGSLDGDHTYTVTLKGSIADMTGATLGEDYSWSFTTYDPNAIRVLSVYPPRGETEVPVNTNISITFSQELEAATVIRDMFSVSGGVTGVVRLSSRTVTFTPDTLLQPKVTYIARFRGTIGDIFGDTAAIDYTWSFTTGDTLPPSVVSVYPADGATNVAPTTNIYLIFSKPIDPASVAVGEFIVDCDWPVGGQIRVSRDTVTFDPTSTLPTNRSTTAVFSGDVTALDGTAAYINKSWTFRAGDMDIVGRYPAVNEGCIPLDAAITIEFARDIEPATVIPANFILTEVGGDTISGTVSSNGSIVILQPDAPLTPLTKYKMVVRAGVKDVYGYALLYTRTWYFSTKAENLLPLAIGNIWVYRVSISQYYPSPHYESYIDSILITRDTTIGDKHFYVDSKRRQYRYENDTIQATAYIPYVSYDKPWLVNDGCNGLVDTIETDVGTFLSQQFILSYTGVLDRYLYTYDFYFAPGVGLTHLDEHVQMPCSGCDEYITWNLLSYELH